MIGELSPSEIENLLHTQTIARLGCHSNGYTYVVPLTYAYDGEAILCYSPEGLKLKMMRENPRVCVEVDHIDSPTAWRCVIAQGLFQELSGTDADEAIRKIRARFASQEASGGATLSHGLDPHTKALGRVRFFAYRIMLETKTGRFEKNTPIDTLQPPF